MPQFQYWYQRYFCLKYIFPKITLFWHDHDQLYNVRPYLLQRTNIPELQPLPGFKQYRYHKILLENYLGPVVQRRHFLQSDKTQLILSKKIKGIFKITTTICHIFECTTDSCTAEVLQAFLHACQMSQIIYLTDSKIFQNSILSMRELSIVCHL